MAHRPFPFWKEDDPPLSHYYTSSYCKIPGSSSLLARWDIVAVVVLQSLSHVRLFVTPWTVAHQGLLPSITVQSLLKFMSIELMTLSNHLSFCTPLFLLSSIFPSLGVFSNESALHIRWLSVDTSTPVLPMNIQCGFPLELTDLISLQSKGLSRVFSSTTV